MIEEGAFKVTATLTTWIDFSPIERAGPLTEQDAIGNAQGTMRDGVWEDFEGEGWDIRWKAERE